MPGRRIGQPGVDLAGEFVSALPGPLRGRTDTRRRGCRIADHRYGQPAYQGRVLAMSSTSCTRRRLDAARRVKAVAG